MSAPSAIPMFGPSPRPLPEPDHTTLRIDEAVRYLASTYETQCGPSKLGSIQRFVASAACLVESRVASRNQQPTRPKTQRRAPTKSVRFDIPEPSKPSSEMKSDKAGLTASAEPKKSSPTGVALIGWSTSVSWQPRSSRGLLPWPAAPKIHPTAPAWYAALAFISKMATEYTWGGYWYLPAPSYASGGISSSDPRYREFLEWKEILGGLGLAYVLSQASKPDVTLRKKLRGLADGGKKKGQVTKSTNTERQPGLLARIRDSLRLVEERLNATLKGGLNSLTTAEDSSAPTAEKVIQHVWVDSTQGHNLRDLLGKLETEIKTLEFNAQKILEHLNNVRPTLQSIKDVKTMRAQATIGPVYMYPMYPITNQSRLPTAPEPYAFPEEVMSFVYQGLLNIQPAVSKFVSVLQRHQDRIFELKKTAPTEYFASKDSGSDKPAVKLLWSQVVGSKAGNLNGEDPAVARVKRQCREWMTRRGNEIRELCNIIQSYPQAAKDAYANLALVRENPMAGTSGENPVFSGASW